VFINNLKEDRSSRRNSEAAKLIERYLTAQPDKDLKHTAKATEEPLKIKQWNIPLWLNWFTGFVHHLHGTAVDTFYEMSLKLSFAEGQIDFQGRARVRRRG